MRNVVCYFVFRYIALEDRLTFVLLPFKSERVLGDFLFEDLKRNIQSPEPIRALWYRCCRSFQYSIHSRMLLYLKD
jgi:hypothetical protein